MKAKKILSLVILIVAVVPMFANESIAMNADERPLLEILGEVRTRIGADFLLAPNLAHDVVSGHVKESVSPRTIEKLLAGYNYEMVQGLDGRINQIIVSGRRGSGENAPVRHNEEPAPGEDLLTYEPTPQGVPLKYLGMSSGSVTAVRIPSERMASMKVGEKLVLSLPTGQYEVVHDNAFKHENGDVTWVGYLDGAGKGYRVIITTGEEGSLGQIVTPDGTFNLDLEEGRNWLVDIGNSGMQAGSLDRDEMDGSLLSMKDAALVEAQQQIVGTPRYLEAKKIKKKAAKKNRLVKLRAGAGSKFSDGVSSVDTVIDLMIVYTRGMNAKTIITRLNFLVATANQAYVDSGIRLQLRLVASVVSDYQDTNENNLALSDLTNGNAEFSHIAEIRQQYGADLVTLIRPFNYSGQKSCGSGWVNGARGSSLYAGLGYSVVSDGRDPSGWYCSDYTLAHELGHNLGSVHERAHSSFAGKFPFSYGYGTEGRFGTIMSYINPVVGVFSNPRLTCKGLPCGDDESADNSRSIGLTAPFVAGFMAATR